MGRRVSPAAATALLAAKHVDLRCLVCKADLSAEDVDMAFVEPCRPGEEAFQQSFVDVAISH